MDFRKRLREPGVIIADGAWGTQMDKRGLGRDEAPEVWNLTHPEKVKHIPVEYLQAGSDLVLTNSFGGSRIKLDKAGIAEHDEVNRLAAALSKEAADEEAFVIASIGPTGELVGLTSDITEEELEETFEAQARAILEGNPDAFVIETMSDLTEAKCALRAVKRVCDLPVVSSMAFDEGRERVATIMGVTPQQAAEELTEAGAEVVGANCGELSNDAWRDVVAAIASATDLPVWAKPNAGIPELVDGESVFGMDAQEFAQLGTSLVDAGAKVFGGCCGTTPEHIAAFAQTVR